MEKDLLLMALSEVAAVALAVPLVPKSPFDLERIALACFQSRARPVWP